MVLADPKNRYMYKPHACKRYQQLKYAELWNICKQNNSMCLTTLKSTNEKLSVKSPCYCKVEEQKSSRITGNPTRKAKQGNGYVEVTSDLQLFVKYFCSEECPQCLHSISIGNQKHMKI
jgi:hypothetical protein